VDAAAADAPSEEEIAREARREIDELSEGPQRLYRQALSDGAIEIGDQRIEGPFAGLFDPSEGHVAINEFVPKQRTVGAGDPISWKMMGADHSITFDVPPYFPIVEFLDDGTVRLNPKLAPPAGGAVPAPEQEGEGVFEVDGGTWDGEGFWSSGLVSAEPYLDYTMRITKPGTYKYACLLHPPMVGTIVVT